MEGESEVEVDRVGDRVGSRVRLPRALLPLGDVVGDWRPGVREGVGVPPSRGVSLRVTAATVRVTLSEGVAEGEREGPLERVMEGVVVGVRVRKGEGLGVREARRGVGVLEGAPLVGEASDLPVLEGVGVLPILGEAVPFVDAVQVAGGVVAQGVNVFLKGVGELAKVGRCTVREGAKEGEATRVPPPEEEGLMVRMGVGVEVPVLETLVDHLKLRVEREEGEGRLLGTPDIVSCALGVKTLGEALLVIPLPVPVP